MTKRDMLVGLCLVAIACGADKTSFRTTEDQRAMARDNSLVLAQKYRADYGLGELEINPRGDSTISNECPQGDGWATIDLVDQRRQVVKQLKCSTYSEGIGCMDAEEFKTKKNWAAEDGKCNSEVPFPLPKIGGK